MLMIFRKNEDIIDANSYLHFKTTDFYKQRMIIANGFFSTGDNQDPSQVPEMPLRPLSDGRNGSGRRPDRRSEESPIPEVSPEEEETQPDVHVAHHRRRRRAQRHLQSRESGN